MPRHEDIAMRAYLIWEREGRHHGYDAEHWDRAEIELIEIDIRAKARALRDRRSVAAKKGAETKRRNALIAQRSVGHPVSVHAH